MIQMAIITIITQGTHANSIPLLTFSITQNFSPQST